MKSMIYPFSRNCIHLYDILKKGNLNIQHFVSPLSWSSKFKNCENIEIEYDYNSAFDDSDMLVITDISDFEWLYSDNIKKIKHAIECGKSVTCCMEIKENDMDAIRNIENFTSDKFNYLAERVSEKDVDFSGYRQINGVVIGIGMLSSGVECDTTFYSVFEKLTSLGYNVVGINSGLNSNLIKGCYAFPEMILNGNISESNKVLLLNNYINELQMRHSADIILIKYPESMLKFSDELHDGFGICSFILSQAVKVDYFILNMQLTYFTAESFPELNNTFKQRFGFSIDAIGYDNKIVDMAESIEAEHIVYRSVDWTEVESEVKRSCSCCNDMLFFSVSDNSFCEKLVSDCIDKLSGDVEVF